MTTTLRTGWPVARKTHTCSWCGQAIEKFDWWKSGHGLPNKDDGCGMGLW